VQTTTRRRGPATGQVRECRGLGGVHVADDLGDTASGLVVLRVTQETLSVLRSDDIHHTRASRRRSWAVLRAGHGGQSHGHGFGSDGSGTQGVIDTGCLCARAVVIAILALIGDDIDCAARCRSRDVSQRTLWNRSASLATLNGGAVDVNCDIADGSCGCRCRDEVRSYGVPQTLISQTASLISQGGGGS
jgi:hypothetical protein